MSKMKRSLSTMLLLSFLASPVYGGKTYVRQNPIQESFLEINRMNLKQQNIQENVILKKPVEESAKKNKKVADEGPSILKPCVAGTAFAFGLGIFGIEKVYDYLQKQKYDGIVQEPGNEIIDESASKNNIVPEAPCSSNNPMDEVQNIEFARFIGLSKDDVNYISKYFDLLIREWKKYVLDNFENLINPFINLKDYKEPMSYELKNELVNEMAITLLMLDYSKYKHYNDDAGILFPFTLLRIYRLTNVFTAMKEDKRDEFKITADWDRCDKSYRVYGENNKFIRIDKKTNEVDLIYGNFDFSNGSFELRDCLSGSPQFKDKNVELNVYYPLLGKIWKDYVNGEYKSCPNESPACEFYKSAGFSGKDCVTRFFTKTKLTLPLLRYIYWFEIHFKQDGFAVCTENINKGCKYIKL